MTIGRDLHSHGSAALAPVRAECLHRRHPQILHGSSICVYSNQRRTICFFVDMATRDQAVPCASQGYAYMSRVQQEMDALR